MLLEVSHITKTYPDKAEVFTALKDVSLRVDAGQRVGIIGESGSGKSTLANIISGLEPADCGTISFDGVTFEAATPPAKRGSEVREKMLNLQMVFQNPTATFSSRMRIGKGILEGVAYHKDFDKARAQSLLDETLDLVGLPREYARRYAFELSGGECQRAAIARAVISRPALLICDEPTSALDVTVQAQILDLLNRLCDELSMACLFISHDLAVVRGLCQHIYVMNRGRIVEEGVSGQLYANPQNDYTKQLLASSIEL